MYNRTGEGRSAGPKNSEVDDKDIEAQNSDGVSNEHANDSLNSPAWGQGSSEAQNPDNQQTSKSKSIADLHDLSEHSWPLRFEAIEDREMRVTSRAGHR
jgi:hypothetical protein